MSTITIVKTDQQKLRGFTERDQRAWRRFKKKLDKMVEGELLQFSVVFPRNPGSHKHHFKVIGAILDNQERFRLLDDLRHYLYLGAGFCDYLPIGKRGGMVAVVKSIAWDKIDEEDFLDIHQKVVEFARSPRCCRFLWPHLKVKKAEEMMATILEALGE